MPDSFFEKIFGQPFSALGGANPEPRSATIRARIPDLNFFFDGDTPLDQRDAPERTRRLARALHAAVEEAAGPAATTLRERIVTDALLRGEADRDQNVYMGKLFTRRLTNALPDLIFQPVSGAEAAAALRWARAGGVPVTLRGAASTAMGGSVPADGGLTLDLSRLDSIDIEPGNGVAVIGAGARLRTIHQRLAERGFALRVYPSNLGGTFAGWFVTGGIGLNAFGRGRALGSVRAADVLLPAGEQVRFHDDGRLDVPDDGSRRRTVAAEDAAAWFTGRGYEPMTLADLAGSEGVFGAVLHLTVAIEPRAEIGAFLLAFDSREAALEAAVWVGSGGARSFPAPANLKLISGSHLHHMEKVWEDDDAKPWRERPGVLSSGARMPWTRIAGPTELGVPSVGRAGQPAASLFVDFLGLEGARAFAAALFHCPGQPTVLEAETVRMAAERFRPQQSKRLGPGLLAAEILMPDEQVGPFLARAERATRHAGATLDPEVYFLADGGALVIAGYLADHRTAAVTLDLGLAAALVDLAMRHHRGRPYVLGRWQAAFTRRRFGPERARALAAMKQLLDPRQIVNRGVLFGLRLRGSMGRTLAGGFEPGIALLAAALSTPLLAGPLALTRAVLRRFPGPAAGRGEPAEVGEALQPASARALHCVNCGECNTVCPIFNDSKIRLPQMLTHLGEALHGGQPIPASGSVLLDLCMRCGNCEEVCQAGIPHLPLYERMQAASDEARPRDRERHLAILTQLRGASGYLRDFLDVRPGGYQKRTPASLPGMVRYLVMRAENDAGPAATCIHCGACVAVCPTHANKEFEGEDPRLIITEQPLCIGCGTCVEVCPANHLNGGQTLRVLEAPTSEWFAAVEAFEKETPV